MHYVTLFTLGGTIASQVDPSTGAARPVLSGADLVGSLQMPQEIDLRVVEEAQVGGSQVTPEMVLALAGRIGTTLADPECLGAMVTQGTDGVEETAYMLDLLIQQDKPIVHAAAMRNNSELGADGPRNLQSALRVAVSQEAVGHGVLVVLNDTIFAASEVVKMHTVNPASFAAPGRGPLGVVTRQKPVFFHRTLTRQHIPTAKLAQNVPIVHTTLGMPGDLIEAVMEKGAQGLVVEAAGAGNVAESAMPALLHAVAMGLPVVLTSSAIEGYVDDVYGYPGGGYLLRQAGVILGQGLTAAKARLKLMIALGAGKSLAEIRDLFEYLY